MRLRAIRASKLLWTFLALPLVTGCGSTECVTTGELPLAALPEADWPAGLDDALVAYEALDTWTEAVYCDGGAETVTVRWQPLEPDVFRLQRQTGAWCEATEIALGQIGLEIVDGPGAGLSGLAQAVLVSAPERLVQVFWKDPVSGIRVEASQDAEGTHRMLILTGLTGAAGARCSNVDPAN